jgi:NitT/TauT family transport system permease protein
MGLSLWYSDRSARLVRPYVIAIGAVPIFAISPMMIIWFGTGLFAKVMMAAISTVTIAVTQSYEGARNIDPGQIDLLRSFRASNAQIFRKLIMPASLIWVFNSLRLNVTLALLGAFIGEFISSGRGLGHRIFQAGGLYDIPLVLSSVICIIGLAFLLNALIWILQRRWLGWK